MLSKSSSSLRGSFSRCEPQTYSCLHPSCISLAVQIRRSWRCHAGGSAAHLAHSPSLRRPPPPRWTVLPSLEVRSPVLGLLGRGRGWGAEPPGSPASPARRQPRLVPARGRERAQTYPLHIPAPPGTPASVPAGAAISQHRVPAAAADSAPGRPACPTPPASPARRPSVRARAPSPAPTLPSRGHVAEEVARRHVPGPAPPSGRRRARALPPKPTGPPAWGLCHDPSAGRSPIRTTPRPVLAQTRPAAPAPRAAGSGTYNGSGAFSSLLRN